jgi:hypothetical protein
MVERWFRELTVEAIRRGVFKSVPALIAAIEAYLQPNNNDPKPFVWTATAEKILEKVSRGRDALAPIPGNNETPHSIPEGFARPPRHATWFQFGISWTRPSATSCAQD